MRYILERTQGEPPAEKPVGMNDILGIGEYVSAANALKFMRPKQAQKDARYTHLAVYTFPRGYADDCKLVLTECIGVEGV